MRATARLVGCSRTTVDSLLMAAGETCFDHHDRCTVGLPGRRHIQCDEIWSFIYVKEKRKAIAKSPPPYAGDVWTFTALDHESKMIVSYLAGLRDSDSAFDLMEDLSSWLNRPASDYNGRPVGIHRRRGCGVRPERRLETKRHTRGER